MLEDYMEEITRCSRCSLCKFRPMDAIDGFEYADVCPSIARYGFHAYAAGGKMNIALGMLEGRIPYTDELLDIVYRCQMCGACDVSCKYTRDMEPLDTLYALRSKFVEDGQIVLAHMPVIDGLRKEDNMMQKPKAERGMWAEGLDVKDINKKKTDVIYHAGCRYSFDKELWPVVRGGVELLKKAGINVGIAGKEEACCAGRAYEMGYEGELIKYAEHNAELFKGSGAKILVTPCAECYQSFKVLYEKINRKLDLEVLHITEYLQRLISQGKLKPSKTLPMTVTYHDPCHLGRMGEPYVRWEGEFKKEPNQPTLHDPPKEFRRGNKGVYDPPRDILKRIPGLRLVEMKRIKEHAWCCGSGGGVKEAYPDFAIWAASKRIREAEETGAKALVTACPWCLRNFRDAVKQDGSRMKIYDMIELLQESVLGKGG